MIKKTQDIKSNLKTWLWNKPARFAAWILLISTLFIGMARIPALVKLPASDIVAVCILLIAFVFTVRGLIKNLPYNKISHSDFVAVLNGYQMLSLVLFSGWTGLTFLMNRCRPSRLLISSINDTITNTHYLYIPDTLFNMLQIIWFTFAAYLLGLWITGIYVKYKRAKDMGISGWKIIFTMPFTFMMAWMPGYMTSDKQQPNITIKSNWYRQLNNWATKNINNSVCMFLLLFIFSTVFITVHTAAILFPLMLFAIYMLWKTLAKNAFLPRINHGYAWTAILINILMLVSFVRMVMTYLQIMLHK